MTDSDKEREMARYDARSREQLAAASGPDVPVLGSQTMPAYLRAPYLLYERRIAELIMPGHHVLELGSGAGEHTLALLRTGARVTASDISHSSLQLLRHRFGAAASRLETRVADMEQPPFGDASFDAIVCAGSLSYGEPSRVDTQIRRLLRPDGMLICVDSLNHNPVYRLNRWLHFLRGNRSRSTLLRMPDLNRIASMGQGFAQVDVRFFGALSYLMPVLARFTGENRARACSDRVDQWIGTRRSAFKFVLVARGYNPLQGAA